MDEVEIKIASDQDSQEVAENGTRTEATDAESNDVEEFRDRWLRAAAELDNMHKRMAKRIEHVALEERRTILSAFLAVVDSLERALAVDGATANDWAKGVAGIHRQMVSTLKRFGAEPIEALGKPFNPNKHEAMAVVGNDNYEDDTVIEVTEVGYELNDGVLLRPARVVVARGQRSMTE